MAAVKLVGATRWSTMKLNASETRHRLPKSPHPFPVSISFGVSGWSVQSFPVSTRSLLTNRTTSSTGESDFCCFARDQLCSQGRHAVISTAHINPDELSL
jgi:hypothetical protein